MSQGLVESSRVRRPAPKPRVSTARCAASDLVRMPARRSTRAQGKPAPNYNESALDLADRVVSRKSRQPFLGEVQGELVWSFSKCLRGPVFMLTPLTLYAVLCSHKRRGAIQSGRHCFAWGLQGALVSYAQDLTVLLLGNTFAQSC